MKKILGVLLTICIITSFLPIIPNTVHAATSGTCGDNLTWKVDNGVLTISGTGYTDNFNSVDIPWRPICSSIDSVIIENGVTAISGYAFKDCNNLKTVSVPSSVLSISDVAFTNCPNLVSINVDENNQSLCSDNGVLFDKNKTKIYHYPVGKTDNQFAIPNSVKYIEGNAFQDCNNLTEVVLSPNIEIIDVWAFSGCKKIKNIMLPDKVKTIEGEAFSECTNLESIYIPKSLSKISIQVFRKCTNLKNVYYQGSKSDWNNIDIDLGNEYLTNATIHYNYNAISVTSITLNTDHLTMKVGATKILQTFCFPIDATNKFMTWSSSNPSVASVDSNGYVTGKGIGTATITAKSHNGKSARCTVTVTNRIDYSNFRYSFGNEPDSFGYSTERPYTRIIPIERYLQAGYPILVAKEKLGKWEGSCFGMSVSSVLFYESIMKEEKYDSSAEAPIDFSQPNAWNGDLTDPKVKLRYMLELLQVSPGSPAKDFSKNAAIQEIDNGTPFVLRVDDRNGNGKHEIVVYDYTINNSTYTFKIYDCSYFVYELICDENNNCYFNYYPGMSTYNDWEPKYIRTVENLKELYYSLYFTGGFSLLSLDVASTYTYILRTEEKLSITNSSGQISTIVDGEISGEIEDIRLIPSSYLAEEPTYTIILPTDTYTIVGSSDGVITTSFADKYMSASVTAKSSTPITISSDLKEIGVDTVADEEYSITYTTYDNIFDEMTLSGTAAGAVSSALNDADITISGVNTLTAAASVSDSSVSASSEGLADCSEVTVKCEETGNDTTIQILSTDAELTEKTTLPERLTVAAPTYDLASGTYEEGQVLTFTKDDDTIIYYTTDGSIPSTDNGIIYSLPIDINKSMTVKAISTKYGYLDSEVVELNYTLPEVDMPQANLKSGEYDKVITVELSTGNYDDTIYYTLDGSNPLENGILYTVPINISEDTSLQAYTIRNGCISEICEYDYVVTPAYPFYFSNSLVNQDGEIITPDNIADLTKVKLTLSKLHTGEQSGLFVVSLYDADNRLIYMKSKTATISEDIGEVEIDITDDVSSAYTMKAFAWKDFSSIQPICEAFEEGIVFE